MRRISPHENHSSYGVEFLSDNEINNIISKYVYGKVSTLSAACNKIGYIKYNRSEKTLMIPKVYDQKSQSLEGECGELAFRVANNLKIINPGCYYYIASVTEPSFYPNGLHFVVAASDKPLLKNESDILEYEDGIASREGIKIIDPCLKVIEFYDESDYSIKSIFDSKNPNASIDKDLILGDKKSNPMLENRDGWSSRRPLGFNDSGELISLCVSYHDDIDDEFNPHSVLCFSIQKPFDYNDLFYQSNWHNLSFINSKSIESLFKKLHEIPLVETKEEFTYQK